MNSTYDPYFLPIILALIFSFWAQWKVKSTYERYSKVQSQSGFSAAEVARKILDKYGLKGVPVKKIPGELSDNYDPRSKELNLSAGVYNSSSVAAIGIAAHEAGHAIQHTRIYLPLKVRNAIFPAANLGANLAIPFFFLGLLLSLPPLMTIGIWFFIFAVAFSVITLPVEFNASTRAINILEENNFLTADDLLGARKVLSAAAMTYLAATLMALLQLLRLLFLRNSRD